MTPETIITPPASTPVADELGNSGRPWYLYFTALTRRLGVLADAVMGWANLTHQGAIPKVSETGTLEESAVTDDGAEVTAADRHVVVTGARPEYRQEVNGGTRPGRVHMPSDGHVLLSSNLRYNGADWICDDETAPGYMLNLNGSVLYFFTAPAGANPRTAALVEAFRIDAAGDYYHSGTKVLGAQMGAVASPAVTISTTLQTADTTYSVNEVTMLNDLKAAITNLNTDVTNLKTAIDGIRGVLSAALGGHGLTA